MRDIIWTVIIVWLVYKFIEIFKAAGQKKRFVYQQRDAKTHTENNFQSQTRKTAPRKSADTEGEYVDYEEIP